MAVDKRRRLVSPDDLVCASEDRLCQPGCVDGLGDVAA